jgi:hypothetical protein
MRTGSVIVSLGLAGCSEHGYSAGPFDTPDRAVPSLEEPTQIDRFLQVVNPAVDTLWVIDNSCSMEDEQAQLTASFPEFIGYFVGSGLDYHVGVTSTDLDGAYNGSAGKLVDLGYGEIFIDVNTDDPVGTFQAMAALGTAGSGSEKGIGATYLALEEQREVFNTGFYRDEAALHTIVITDEPDYTTVITEGEFIDWYSGVKRDPEERTFSCIIDPYTGGQYSNLSAAIGGLVFSRSHADWPSLLDQLGLLASGTEREFYLSHVPVPDEVQVVVEVEGELAFIGTDEWTYSRTRNSVSFDQGYVPPPGAIVWVEYTLAAQHGG